MSILLIGGDSLGNITEKLIANGFEDIEHITGRKNDAKNFKIPRNIDLVMVLVDFVSHKLTAIVKEESKRSDVKIAFSKRSWTHMEKKIQQCAKELTDVKKVII
ncbi:MAG: DUF2325 domain-containing protein [Clostridiaceae bacterium]|nr:DUF2325 domain-containing protein [Clostridiaceae bacterium]